MKARPAPLESMVKIVERSAMHIRSGPARALSPGEPLNKLLPHLINQDHFPGATVIHRLALPPAFKSPSAPR
jgi:hypothetical protein